LWIWWLLSANVGRAADISGTIGSTLTIFDDSRLVGDVTCTAAVATAPCIVFGASNIKLRLNGHTITGPVNPLTNLASCSKPTDSSFGVGLEAIDQNDIQIQGPGVIQHFERWGILVRSVALASVKDIHILKVTANLNCWSGLQIIGVEDSQFEDNVWANNAVGSNGAACGGICLVSSHKNVVHKNTFYGNGTAAFGSAAFGNVDFGIGLEGTSSENRIEENDIGGNTNGILVFATASGNVIRHNVIVGNPPAQVSVDFPSATGAGADIHDRHTSAADANMNTFEDNFCLTYLGLGNPPCPNISRGEADVATNRLASPAKNPAESNPGQTGEHGRSIFSLVLVILASAFGGRLVLG
jgi:parallel beta-helix repeat protein